MYYQLRDGIAKNQFEEDEAVAKSVLPLETKIQAELHNYLHIRMRI